MRSTRVMTVLALAATALFTTSMEAGATSLDLSEAARATKAKAITKNTKASYDEWALMRSNQSQAWVAQYQFNWRTDGCDNSPDKPGGFNFKTPCARHDFGYANTKHLVSSSAWQDIYKPQVDKAFYYDMTVVCRAAGNAIKTAACMGFAKTYYEAVKKWGE
ncbi:phospholipase A2 [Nonomuraea sp. SBT364]|uniref:phospholipase A2 n=1 Tax=Nonomuraea sp. SBT364 TaxID=1580530 RepID=UPI0007C795B3|nr:phospholipase A2 [Nonomuraea sp. SBT364]